MFVIRLLGQRRDGFVVQPDVQHGVHHAGHRFAGARPAGEEQRVLLRAERGPHYPFDPRECLTHPILEFRRIGLVVVVVVDANLGGNGKTGRHGQPDIGHLGEIGAFASQEISLRGVAIGLAVTEEINVLRLSRHAESSLVCWGTRSAEPEPSTGVIIRQGRRESGRNITDLHRYSGQFCARGPCFDNQFLTCRKTRGELKK